MPLQAGTTTQKIEENFGRKVSVIWSWNMADETRATSGLITTVIARRMCSQYDQTSVGINTNKKTSVRQVDEKAQTLIEARITRVRQSSKERVR